MPKQEFSIPFYYVYLWFDPRTNAPIYVGKGTAHRSSRPYDRAHQTHRNNQLLMRVCGHIAASGLKVIVVIGANFSLEADALAEEKRLIALYGRRQFEKGPLCNLTDGGQGQYNRGQEVREKMRAATTKRWADPEQRRRMQEAISRGMRAEGGQAERSKAFWTDPVKHAAHCKSLKVAAGLPSSRHKKSVITQGQWADAEMRAKKLAGLKRGWTPERREKQHAKTWGDPEYKERLIASLKASIDAAGRARRADQMRLIWQDPDMRQRQSNAIRAAKAARRAERNLLA